MATTVSARPQPPRTVTIKLTRDSAGKPVCSLDRPDPSLASAPPPKLAFRHKGPGSPKHEHPHELRFEIEGLLALERVEIRLDQTFPGYAAGSALDPPQPWLVMLHHLFPGAYELPSKHFGWELTAITKSVSTGSAESPSGRYELNGPVRYKVVFYDDANQEWPLDPDVEVTPDP